MKNTQEISRKDLAAIYKSNICDSWKKKIADAIMDCSDCKTIEVSNDVIKAAYSEANTEQKKLIEKFFEIHTEIDKIKNIDDVYKLNGVKSDILPFKNPKNPYQKYLNSCALIPLIVNAYNENQELNWSDGSSKYLPYYKKVWSGWVFDFCDHWFSASFGSASHHYRYSDHVNDAVIKFNDVYVSYFSYKG